MKSIVALAACLACAAPAAAQIRIGILAPMTGAIPIFGASVSHGVDLAIRECNQRGGIRGNQIEAVVEDGACAADIAVEGLQKLIGDDHIRYFIGEVCSAASIAVSEIAEEAHVIQITPTSTNRAVTVDPSGQTKSYVFRSCFIDSYQGVIAARFAYVTLGARRAFILRNSENEYDSTICDSFADEFRLLGGAISGDTNYSSRRTDFRSMLSGVAQSNSDIVCLPDYYNVVNLVTRQAREMELSVPFIGGDGWDSGDLAVRFAAGSYFVNHFSSEEPRPEAQAFVSAYRNAYKDESNETIAALAYDAAQMLFQAIQAAGSDDPARVRDALESIHFKGVTGALTFDDLHNPLKTGVIMAVTDNGVRFEADVNP